MSKIIKNVVIIGASSGIGKELAIQFAQLGCNVRISARREELLKEVANENPSKIEYSIFDVNELNSISTNLLNIFKSLDTIDLIIFSSAFGKRNPQLDIQIEEETLKTNVAAFTVIADFCYNYITSRGDNTIFASITSIAGIRGWGISPAYSASKSYQSVYLEALRQRAKNQKSIIHVVEICPGFVDTQMGQGSGVFWRSSAKKAAKQIINSINKSKRVIYITKRWRLIAIILKLIPKFIFENLKY